MQEGKDLEDDNCDSEYCGLFGEQTCHLISEEKEHQSDQEENTESYHRYDFSVTLRKLDVVCADLIPNYGNYSLLHA